MNMNKKTSIAIVILVIAILIVGWKLLSKGGLFALELPQPNNVQTTVNATGTAASTENGAVLGDTETANYSNPLTNIYVNPFEK